MKLKAQAERYCSLIEQVESMERETFVVEITAALTAVLHAAMDLPDLSPTDEDDDKGISHEEWWARFDAIEARLGDWSAYTTTLSPFDEDATEAATLALADDLADVWRDLKTGLLSLERGGHREDVLLGLAIRLLHPLGTACRRGPSGPPREARRKRRPLGSTWVR